MRIRLIALAVMALAGLTAFAPAPFMKSGRDRAPRGDVLAALQGTWSVSEKQRMGPNGRLSNYKTSQKIRIEEDGWSFVSSFALKGGKGGLGGLGKAPVGGRPLYRIKVEPGRRRGPVVFRVKRTANDDAEYMVGVLHVSGDTIKMLYRLGSTFGGRAEEKMPTNFDTIPENWYLQTLTRDK